MLVVPEVVVRCSSIGFAEVSWDHGLSFLWWMFFLVCTGWALPFPYLQKFWKWLFLAPSFEVLNKRHNWDPCTGKYETECHCWYNDPRFHRPTKEFILKFCLETSLQLLWLYQKRTSWSRSKSKLASRILFNQLLSRVITMRWFCSNTR